MMDIPSVSSARARRKMIELRLPEDLVKDALSPGKLDTYTPILIEVPPVWSTYSAFHFNDTAKSALQTRSSPTDVKRCAQDDRPPQKRTKGSWLTISRNAWSLRRTTTAPLCRCLNSRYRELHIELACNRADKAMPEMIPENKTVYYADQLQGMRWVDVAWEGVTDDTIKHCFQKSGVVFPDDKENCPPPPRRQEVKMNDILI
ncbi:hypothetical protein ON010_g12202 [Phytophthora cinnamomi]|nr:hypothetical protein ON010_g12202 [Phytophthora cinnamomi]